MDMQVAALFIYDRALSAAEQTDLQTYLQEKYFGAAGQQRQFFPQLYEEGFFYADYVQVHRPLPEISIRAGP